MAGASLVSVCAGPDAGTQAPAGQTLQQHVLGGKAARHEAPHIHVALAPHPNALFNIQQ